MEKQYSLPPLKGLLSFPTQEIMQYGLDHKIIESPGLMMHIVLGRIIVFQMTKVLSKEVDFDLDTAMSLTTVYHATRQDADYGKAGNHPDPKVNEFMKDHGDMEYALKQAEEHGLSPAILQGIRQYLINPRYRESYFPHETLSPNGEINWTEAIPMLTSWLVAGVVTHTDKRFNDLRDRRSVEIGKLELTYWQEQLGSGNNITLPQPIVEIALKSGEYTSVPAIVSGIRGGSVTNEIMGKWILDGYEEWANKVIGEFVTLTGLDDFYEFLESGIDTIEDNEITKREKIKTAFESMFGRELADDEFIPYIDGIDIIFNRINGLKSAKTRDRFRVRVARTMQNIEPIVERLKRKDMEQ